MSITDEFDPTLNGWFFENWGEATDLSWELFRNTYLAINPTHDCVEAPLDCLFFEIFKGCAAKGNCGGMSMLALALWKFGGFMGFCSPASFYTGTTEPDRTDLHEAINIMQARQFSAPGIQNFLDAVKAGDLNNAEAAFNKIKSGLGSGDYAMLSISNGLFGDAAHTVVPYRIDEHPIGYSPGTKLIYVYDPNRPFDTFPDYYTASHNKMVLSGPTNWTYDQSAGGFYSSGTLYDGSNNGWCFALPVTTEIHKARHPISVGFAVTGLTLLFVSGVGAAVTQIEDEDGHRFYTSDGPHVHSSEIETSSLQRLQGVARWPWFDAAEGGELPGELYLVQRPVGSSPLTLTVSGSRYSLRQLHVDNLVEIESQSASTAREKIRIDDFTGDQQTVEIQTNGTRRRFQINQLRTENGGADWSSLQVQNAYISKSDLRLQASPGFESIDISTQRGTRLFDIEFQQYRSNVLERKTATRRRVSVGKSVHLASRDLEMKRKPEAGKRARKKK